MSNVLFLIRSELYAGTLFTKSRAALEIAVAEGKYGRVTPFAELCLLTDPSNTSTPAEQLEAITHDHVLIAFATELCVG